jgi:hypothetical protein
MHIVGGSLFILAAVIVVALYPKVIRSEIGQSTGDIDVLVAHVLCPIIVPALLMIGGIRVISG